jgi:outer membrane protein TolC
MHKSLTALSAVLVGCSTPAYRAPEVPVPSSYSVSSVTPVPVGARGTSEDVPTPGIQVSTALASTPFWSDLGDSTLTMLIREAQRANLDVRVAKSRLTSARAARPLVAYCLMLTIMGTGSTSR